MVVAGAAAVGQTAGKVLLYYAADWAMNLPGSRRRWPRRSGRRPTSAGRSGSTSHPGQTAALLFASASLGFPPLYVMAVLAGQLRVNIWLFVGTCLVGRYIRFLVLVGAADWLVHLF